MKKKDRTYRLFLEDMFLAMNRVAEYINGLSFIDFKHDYKTVDAVIRNFEVIGEASKNMPKDIKDKYPMVPWDEMYLMRNKISMSISVSIMRYFGM
jgi:uncharacterized protein with HEPN domain